MIIDTTLLQGGILIGIGATLLIDLWAIFLKKIFKVASLNFCLLGRWIAFILEGKFKHLSIAKTDTKKGECLIGWIAHYVIGIIFGLTLVYLTNGWLAKPELFPALTFGLITVLLPFFIMQPAFGFGIAASKMPDPLQARLKSVMTHLVFGLGLYLSAIVLQYFAIH